ncbi:hypothetical protein KJ632_00855, partial [Patescibacteria group bacterium]|nr:hypothetical protein [Patescibacteria group bacterium]
IKLTSIGNQLIFVDDGYIKSSADNTIELQSAGTLDFKIADRIPVKFQYTDVFFYAGVVFNQDSADYDFRVEGNGDANLIFADAGVDKVGIGTNGPDAKLDSLSTTEQLRLTYADGTVYSSFTVDLNGDLTIAPTGGDVAITADLAVNGATSADITSITTTATIFNTTVTTLSLGGVATSLLLGAATGTTTINNTSTIVTGDLAVNGGDITTTATTLNIDVGNTGTINFRDGTNSLAAVKDQGDYVFWNLKGKSDTGDPATCSEGDIYYNAFDDTVSVCHAGNTWEGLDGGGGGSSLWSALLDPTGNLSLAMAEYTSIFTWNTADTATALDAFSLTLTNDATTDANIQRLLVLQNNNAVGSTATERLLVLNNADTTEAVTTALEIISEAGTITTAIDVSDAEIVTALLAGANDLTGTNWSITGSSGNITTAGDLGITAATNLIIGGTTSLGEITAANDSGAYLVGTYDEFDNSASTTVQGVLNDLDIALATGGAGSMWTLGSGVIYPTSATSDFAVGGSTLAASMFGIDESAGNFYFGYDNSANPTFNFEATDADAGEFGFNTNDSFYFSNANVGIGTTSPGAKLQIDTVTDVKGLIVKGMATQTANLQEWQNSSGTVLGFVNGVGGFGIGNSAVGDASMKISNTVSGSSYIFALNFQPTLTSSAQHVYGGYFLPTITIIGSKWAVGVASGANGLTIGAEAGTSTHASFYAAQPATLTGTLDVDYGIYVEARNKATTNYAIYTNAGLNRLGDQLSIVGSADRTQLAVTGNGTQTSALATFVGGNVGIGTTAPDKALEINSATGNNLRLTYNDSDGSAANYSDFSISSSGDLTITPTGGQVIFADTATLNIGGLINVAYNAFANATDTPSSTAIAADNDLFIGGDLELKGGLYLTGRNIYNTVGGVSTGAISLATDPAAINSYNTLSYGSWLVQNATNNGIAALMVDQTKGGDIFTASSSGTTKFTIHKDGAITLASDISSTTNTTEGTIFYDNDSAGSASTDHLFLYGSDAAWHRIALDMTKYTVTNASVANTSYVEVAHNQNTNDLTLVGWVKNTLTGLWDKITDKSVTITQNLQNQFDDSSSKIRTQTRLTNVELAPSVDVGTGADGAITVSSNTSINTTSLISARSCADGGDAVNYSVTTLTSTTAVLSTTPSTGCLAVGDEILLINLQATNAAFVNAGNYETLRIQSISTNTITFTTAKTKYYGNNSTDDTNLGTTAGTQRVMLQRVPNYTNVTVNSSINFYPTAWNGTKGGVMFFRANGAVSVSGIINANTSGYAGGATQRIGGAGICGIGGASAGGTGAGGGGGVRITGNGGLGYCGGGGGGSDTNGLGAAGSSTSGGAGGAGGQGGNGVVGGCGAGGGGAGYGSAGTGGGGNVAGGNGGTNSSGSGGNGGTTANGGGGGGGGTLGESTLSKMFLGSGGGAGGGSGSSGGAGGTGGGIINISANSITISGAVQSNSSNGSAGSDGCGGGGGGGAGGSVALRANTLTLGTNLLSATGGTGGSGTYSGGTGGSGRTAIYYTTSYSGSASSPTPTYTSQPYYPYGLYHSAVINTPNAISLSDLRWETATVANAKVSFQTRSGNTTTPTDGTWEVWRPMVNGTNYLTLQTADTHTDWVGTNAVVAEGDVTRNIDYFEDEDEATATNITKITSSTNGGYAGATISSTNLSNYDYLTFWVRSSQTGNVLQMGMGEAAATEQTEIITVDAANTWQKVYWDLSDIAAGSRDGITKLRLTNLVAASNTIYIDNVRVEKAMTTSGGTPIVSTPNNYFQYRTIFTTTDTSYQPQLENVSLSYNNGFKTVQTDANTVRLYNYSGSAQELRLDAIVFGADLAEWYTVDDQTIGPGDLVSLTGKLDEFGVPILKKAEGRSDRNLLGIISTKAGQTLGIEAENRRLLALAGRVPVKIDPDSPAITTGDAITSSDKSGYARKAGFGDIVVAKASHDWNPTKGESLLVIVNNSSARNTFLADIDEYEIIKNLISNTWELINKTSQEALETAGAFAKIIAAEIQAGAVETKSLATESFLAFQGVVDNLLINNGLVSPVVQTNLISPLADSSDINVKLGSEATPSGKLSIQNILGEEVASIDSSGSAEFKNASISGELYAESIVSPDLDKIQELLRQVQQDQGLLAQTATWNINTATDSAQLFESLSTTDLYVTNQAAVNSLSVSNSLSLGMDMVIQGSQINTLTSPLSLQSLAMAPVEIMAGKFKIETNGDVTINANLYVAGKIKSPEAEFDKLTTGNLVIANSIATQSAVINGNEINSNAMIGTATVPVDISEIIINNQNILDNTLIYVTPTSETQNNVLYVKNKELGKFVVGFVNPLNIEVTFNWWVVQVQNQQ